MSFQTIPPEDRLTRKLQDGEQRNGCFPEPEKLQSSSTRSLKIIVSQAWPEEGEILIDRSNHRIKVFVLVGHNMIFPRNAAENIMPRINQLISKGFSREGW